MARSAVLVLAFSWGASAQAQAQGVVHSPLPWMVSTSQLPIQADCPSCQSLSAVVRMDCQGPSCGGHTPDEISLRVEGNHLDGTLDVSAFHGGSLHSQWNTPYVDIPELSYRAYILVETSPYLVPIRHGRGRVRGYDGQRALHVLEDGGVRVFDLVQGLTTALQGAGPAQQAALVPSGVVISGPGGVTAFTDAGVLTLQGNPGPFKAAGDHVLVSNDAGSSLYDVAGGGQLIATLPPVADVAADGTAAFAVRGDGGLDQIYLLRGGVQTLLGEVPDALRCRTDGRGAAIYSSSGVYSVLDGAGGSATVDSGTSELFEYVNGMLAYTGCGGEGACPQVYVRWPDGNLAQRSSFAQGGVTRLALAETGELAVKAAGHHLVRRDGAQIRLTKLDEGEVVPLGADWVWLASVSIHGFDLSRDAGTWPFPERPEIQEPTCSCRAAPASLALLPLALALRRRRVVGG